MEMIWSRSEILESCVLTVLVSKQTSLWRASPASFESQMIVSLCIIISYYITRHCRSWKNLTLLWSRSSSAGQGPCAATSTVSTYSFTCRIIESNINIFFFFLVMKWMSSVWQDNIHLLAATAHPLSNGSVLLVPWQPVFSLFRKNVVSQWCCIIYRAGITQWRFWNLRN